ncbi:MAG TPA: esterase-like activity of phytase family protein [Thiolinea sp.]|nr:esterase-like activity of phytase family protein [Thiolinea sp.]
MMKKYLPGYVLVLAVLGACSLPASTSGNSALQVLDYHVIPRTDFNGIRITELSGLAWDEDEQLLYGLSDRGRIFHFRFRVEDELIREVTPVYAAHLADRKGRLLSGKESDSEGLLALNANNGRKGDTQLVISFERQPRLARFTPQGREVAAIPLAKPLQDVSHYRNDNNALESVTWHPKYGFITAPEEPLVGQPRNLHTLYALKKQWSFMAYPAPNSFITGLEFVPGSDDLIVLERAWSGFPNPMVNSIRRVNLARCSPEGTCPVENLQVFSSSFSIDNFEGLTHIRDNLYLMVSDDGENDLLRTLLTLFKIQ